MLNKLAIRNVRRQIGNYMIYFVTVSCMLGLLFAMNNQIYSRAMNKIKEASENFEGSMTGIVVFVCIISALFMGYATSFMIKLRRKEFGLYLTMGMKRSDIIKMFLMENLFLNAISFGAACLLGLVFSQLISAFFALIFEIPASFMEFSLQGLCNTILMSLGIFVLSSLSSLFYLRKVDIINLLHATQKERSEKHLPLHISIMILAGITLGVGAYMEYTSLLEGISGDGEPGMIMVWILVLFMSVFVFSMELARNITGLLIKNRKRSTRGTNMFVLRNISGVMSVNAVMMGLIATLLCVSVGISCVAFVEKNLTVKYTDIEAPFDIVSETGINSARSVEESEAIIRKYVEIKNKISVPVYRHEKDCGFDTYIRFDLITADQTEEEEYDDLNENNIREEAETPPEEISFTMDPENDKVAPLIASYIRESDMNRLLAQKGMEQIHLGDGEVAVFVSYAMITDQDIRELPINVGGKTYCVGQIYKNAPEFTNEPAFYVIADAAVEQLTLFAEVNEYTLGSQDFDFKNLENELGVPSENYLLTEHTIRALVDYYYKSETGSVIIAMGYISSVLLFMSLAILSLKVFASISDDKPRYEILERLGACRGERERALFRQLGIYFLVPCFCPIIFTPVMAFIFGKVGECWGMARSVTATTTCLVAMVILIVYYMYFLVTAEVAKRATI